jgi:hypothetical protein
MSDERKRYRAIILLAACAVPCMAACGGMVDPASPVSGGPKDAVLVFSDEFNGKTLDVGKWTLGVNPENTLDSPLQKSVYRKQNISVGGGHLILSARHEPDGVEAGTNHFNYSSAAITSEGRFHLKQNMYVEFRIKLPVTAGSVCMGWSVPQETADALSDPASRPEIYFFEFVAAREKRHFISHLRFRNYLENEIPGNLEPSDYFQADDHYYRITNMKRMAHWYGDLSAIPRYQLYDWYDWSDFVTVGFRATPEKLAWHISETGSSWKSPPYITFEGGTLHSDSYGKKKHANQDIWTRGVPITLNNTLIFSHALFDDNWSGRIENDQLPAQMMIDYVRVYQLPDKVRTD